MAIELVSFPIKNGGSFHSFVKLPEGNAKDRRQKSVVFQVLNFDQKSYMMMTMFGLTVFECL